jgi:hypothetical protein
MSEIKLMFSYPGERAVTLDDLRNIVQLKKATTKLEMTRSYDLLNGDCVRPNGAGKFIVDDGTEYQQVLAQGFDSKGNEETVSLGFVQMVEGCL